MRFRVYLDTSVFGAVFDVEDPLRVALTRKVLRRVSEHPYQAYVGDPVFEEIALAPARLRSELERMLSAMNPIVVREDQAALRLGRAYMNAGLVPPAKYNDARHIALATVTDLDAIVSWNFKDMVNIHKKAIVHSVNLKFGYRLIDIVSPPEVYLE